MPSELPVIFRRLLVGASLALLFTGCSQYAEVSTKEASWTRPKLMQNERVGRLLSSNLGDAEEKLGRYVEAASLAAADLRARPTDPEARTAYNFAVARAIETIQKVKADPWSEPLQLSDTNGGYTITVRRDPRKHWRPSLFNFTPADQFDVKGKYVNVRETRKGIGAPVVAASKHVLPDADKLFVMPRAYYGVTAILRFTGKTAEFAFEDPLASETTVFEGKTFDMAADFTVPLAVMLASTDPKKLELSRLLRPEKYADTARICRLQPYDPNKTVVLVAHGLMDSQATWTPMINHLRADPFIRANYQFWFYSYPSGYPYPHSAAILRENLDAIEKAYPLRKKMVVIGHSMGGCISRLLITDSGGEKLWREILGKAPADMKMSDDSRKLFSNALIFEPRDEVGRVIFISAPLKGSMLATGWIGRIGTSLVKAPVNLLKAGNEVMQTVTFQEGDLKLKRIPDSIDTLAPNSRFVRVINTFPFEDVPHHVICGDRGKGGNKDKTKPVMSDGVVPYWSSHMPTAKSEKIVPSGHSAHQHPESFAEVKRILKEHAGRN
ncbi:MAG: esterase/lipase family protein [Verrucomicrobiales bacterium]